MRRRERDRADPVLEFSDDPPGELGADAGRANHRVTIAGRQGRDEIVGGKHSQNPQRELGSDALDGGEPTEPIAFRGLGEAVELDSIVAHLGLDEQARRSARIEGRERARRSEHQVADAVHVDDRGFRANRIHDAAQLGDHKRPSAADASRPDRARTCIGGRWWA